MGWEREADTEEGGWEMGEITTWVVERPQNYTINYLYKIHTQL